MSSRRRSNSCEYPSTRARAHAGAQGVFRRSSARTSRRSCSRPPARSTQSGYPDPRSIPPLPPNRRRHGMRRLPQNHRRSRFAKCPRASAESRTTRSRRPTQCEASSALRLALRIFRAPLRVGRGARRRHGPKGRCPCGSGVRAIASRAICQTAPKRSLAVAPSQKAWSASSSSSWLLTTPPTMAARRRAARSKNPACIVSRA